MEILVIYLIFALATGICSIYELFLPVWRKLKQSGTKAVVLEYGYTVAAVFFFGAIIAAPVAFIACIVPTLGESFRNTFEVSLLAEGQ